MAKKIESFHDCCTQEVKVGDWVVFVEPKYRGFVFGKVIKITPKKCTLKYVALKYVELECSEGVTLKSSTTTRFHDAVIKHPYSDGMQKIII